MKITMRRRGAAAATVAATMLALSVGPRAGAEPSSCPLPGQKPLLMIQLYFGLSVPGRSPVNSSEWDGFLRRSATPLFPQGLTVYDGYGQWLGPTSHHVVRENSKVMMIAAPDSAETREKITQLTEIYRRDFHQQAVGILTMPACGAF